jgi:ERCC4-type nuclease
MEQQRHPPPGGRRVTLTLDVRERSLAEAVRRLLPADDPDVALAVSSLLLGDAELALTEEEGGTGQQRLVVERKTLADLAASIKDGRYREQKARLLANVGTAGTLYVLEGATFCFDARMRGGAGGLPPATLQSAAVSMLVRDGVRLVQSRDVDDTAAFLLAAARKLRPLSGRTVESAAAGYAAAACASAVKAKKRENVTPVQCFVQQLCQLPGVSVRVAGTLQGAFGSMAELYGELTPLAHAGRAARLASLPGIGSKSAERLCAYLFQDAAD